MVDLKNFEAQIAPVILKRGESYYRKGNVISIDQVANGVWAAEVEGSDSYSVEVTIDDKDHINGYSCDCPIGGGLCKHVVAVLFVLRNEIVNAGNKPIINSKKGVFESMLNLITQNEYQTFIRDYAAKNKNFKTEFELFFAEKDSRVDVADKYSELVNRLIKKYTTRGYIDYKASFGLSREIEKILATGQGYIAKNNFRDAFALAKSILKPMMEAIIDSDDSNGNIGDCINSSLELFENISLSKVAAFNIKEEVFEFVHKELEDENYFEYGDYGYNLFSIFQELAVLLNKAPIFLYYTNARIEGRKGNDDNYRKEYFKKRIIAFFQQTGNTTEVEKLVQQNMDIFDVRMSVIDKAMQKKDYKTAKKIIREGIKIAEAKSHPGTVSKWENELLRIAYFENDIPTIRNFTKRFAFERGVSKEYYQQWKNTFTPTEWKFTIEQYISESIQNVTVNWNKSKYKSWNASPHPPLLQSVGAIYILEKYLDRLLPLVQQANNLNTTLDYHQFLLKDYASELLSIYLPTLEEYGIKANSRNDYEYLVKLMKKIIYDIPNGKQDVLAVAKRLRDRFSIKPRRPAMIEVLEALLK